MDPRTACYVRFYHEKFQRDKPELLHQIKRATKTDQQSKDDVDSLKHEVCKLREQLELSTAEYDRKLAELSYECNRRITAMNVEYDKLSAMVQRTLGCGLGVAGSQTATPGVTGAPAGAPLAGSALATSQSLLAASNPVSGVVPDLSVATQVQVPDLLHSLSQAAVSLQTHLRTAQQQQQLQQQQQQLQHSLPSLQQVTTPANFPMGAVTDASTNSNGKRPAASAALAEGSTDAVRARV